jgi:transposase
VLKSYNVDDLLVLDESGANLAMARIYGRVQGSNRLVLSKPYHLGNKYSIISTISTQRIIASLYCSDSIDGDIFTTYIEQCLAPTLESRHKVIMDNVAFHKVGRAGEVIKNTGAEIIYLPPYSPDLSPIELMWSKIKSILRKFAARTEETFHNAIKIAFQSVQAVELEAWFKHCGYGIK